MPVFTVLEIEEMVQIRGVLESLAAGRAAERITDEEVEGLGEIARQLAIPFPKSGEKEFLHTHVEFHQKILTIANSPRLKTLLRFHQFIDQLLLNCASPMWYVEAHDHMGVVNAIASRDVKKAETVMREHIAPTYTKRFDALRKRFGEGPILP